MFTEEKIEKYHDMMVEIYGAATCEKERNRAAYYDMMSLLGASVGDLIPYLHDLARELKEIGDQVYESVSGIRVARVYYTDQNQCQHTTRDRVARRGGEYLQT